jgi:uncharacterized repeat protein (TIGR01451 family)
MKYNKSILFLLFLLSTSYVQAQLIVTKSITAATCNNNDASVSVSVTGGTAPYLYEWRLENSTGQLISTSASVSNLAPNLYSIKVTDANNDFQIDSIVVNNGILGYVSTTSPAVCPQQNGVVEAYVQGGVAPYTYFWSNGSTAKVVSNLAGGTLMQVEIKDANGCSAYNYYSTNVSGTLISTTLFETTVGSTSTIQSNYTTTPEECPLTNGSITLSASNGVAPYTYIWNTSPVKSGAAITGLTSGYYTATITDAQGCRQTTGVYVNKNAGALNVTAIKTNDYCSKKQGTADLTITGGVPPYSVAWPDGSAALSRIGLEYGVYNVVVSDQNNCVFNLPIFINDDSPILSFVNISETNCDNTSGTAQVIASNGTAPYSYQWNTASTNASINSLSMGYYSVLVTDAAGCKSTTWAFVPIKNSCYAAISGKVFQDDNGNCIQEAGELPILNQWVNLRAASTTNYLFDQYSGTNNMGQYAMRYVLPDQYIVKNSESLVERTAACPATGDYNFTIPTSGVDYTNKDFAMVPSSLFEDVALFTNYCNVFTPPRPGFNYSYSIPFKNNGTLPSDGFIEVVYGNLETFVSSFPAADFYDPTTKTLRFNYSSLMLGEIRNINITFNLPPTTLLGSTYNHTATADIGGTDPTPQNNQISYPFTVVGSYDPNDLAVTPAGVITESDEVLTYTIRFQNTGTYPAELVVIKDVIDQNLDITTISDIVVSHPYKLRVLENRTVEFAFENINLPDETRDEPGSHGFVTFKIRKKPNLALGTEITNTANIYFDFNDPIITNTTVNTMGIATGTTAQQQTNAGTVYPNPAKNYTSFRFDESITLIQLITVSGTEVLNQEVDAQKEFGIPLHLSKGMYVYKALSIDGNLFTGKLIIE